ncbi:MAG: restriction endonuclease subunit S [Wenzhouxiangella sp.]
MRRWPKFALSELLQDASEPVRVQADADYPNIGIYSFGRGLFAKPPISGLQTSAKTLYRIRTGNFIYSRLFAFEGSYGLVDDTFDGYFTSNEYPSFSLDQSRLEPGFLRAYFQFPRVWQDIAMGSKGVGSRRIRVQPDKVLAHQIPLPPLAEQQAIVSRLDTLADKVRQVNEHLDAIEQKAAALFLSLHYKLSGDRVRRLGDVVELQEESVPVRADSEYPQVGVRGFGGGLFAKAAVAGTETSYRAFNRLYADALVLSQVKGWEGALAICPPELAGKYVSPEYRTFRCIPEEATPGYIGELVRTPWFWSLLQDATRGVGARRERTRPEQFLNIELPMPPEDKQRKVVEILNRQAHLRSRHATIRQANDALTPATLERVFSGAG